MIGLIDCNNFYVSCELLFRPDLRHKPVVVLSNNDGCAISRSNEAKALGIRMGDPLFRFSPLVKRHHVHIFSSNFALYGDLSARVMTTVRQHCPDLEVYSVDEAFLDAAGIQDLRLFGQQLREKIATWIGIPTSIGFAPTKVLAKIANHCAKKDPIHKDVCIFQDTTPIDDILFSLGVGEVWGIGRKLTERLATLGIRTALGLKRASPQRIRSTFSIVEEKIVRELNGESCFDLQSTPVLRQSIQVSRSFKADLVNKGPLEEKVCAFAFRAGEKLRDQQSACKKLTVHIRSNPFTKGSYYSKSADVIFSAPVSEATVLIKAAQQALGQIYNPNFSYKRAGVVLSDFVQENQLVQDFFLPPNPSLDKISATMDTLNKRFGSKTVYLGACGVYSESGNRSFKSPAYTTAWDQILRI